MPNFLKQLFALQRLVEDVGSIAILEKVESEKSLGKFQDHLDRVSCNVLTNHLFCSTLFISCQIYKPGYFSDSTSDSSAHFKSNT